MDDQTQITYPPPITYPDPLNTIQVVMMAPQLDHSPMSWLEMGLQDMKLELRLVINSIPVKVTIWNSILLFLLVKECLNQGLLSYGKMCV